MTAELFHMALRPPSCLPALWGSVAAVFCSVTRQAVAAVVDIINAASAGPGGLSLSLDYSYGPIRRGRGGGEMMSHCLPLQRYIFYLHVSV